MKPGHTSEDRRSSHRAQSQQNRNLWPARQYWQPVRVSQETYPCTYSERERASCVMSCSVLSSGSESRMLGLFWWVRKTRSVLKRSDDVFTTGMLLLALVLGASLAQQQQDTLDLLWPSPLLKVIDPIAQAGNAALRKMLLSLGRTERSVQKTNVGGWQSDVDLFERSDPEIALLRTRTYHAAFRYLQSMAPPGSEGRFEVSIGSAWANLNNRTHSNSPHMHPGVQFSGVYYVDDGGSRLDGIRLVDPRAQAAMVPVPARWTYGMGEHVRVQAVPGLFVLFPAWLQHYVVAHEGRGTRISVSFNVRVTFPPEDDAAQPGFVGSAGAADDASSSSSSASRLPPPQLSFVVPPHHQKDFLDAKLSKDMKVGKATSSRSGGGGGGT